MTTPDFVPGLELSRRFYLEAVLPILDKELPGLPHAAARLGSGSEVLGFDTARSTDHDWGPQVQLFLAPDDVARHRERLLSAFAYQLPETFLDYPAQVDVAGVDDWLTGCLGFTPSRGVRTADWLATPTQRLVEATSGAVFHDGLGQLTVDRARLAWYPREVWRYVLACQWKRISQEEAFVGRCGEVGDEVGSAVVAARQVRDLMKLCLLMNRVYPPYSKWLGTAFATLPCADTLTPVFAEALAARTWKDREHHLSAAYEIVAALHNDLGLTEPLDTSVRLYYSRPFQVVAADRFHDALLATIIDPAIRDLPPVGAIDQYVDSTDLTDRNYVDRRSHYIAGPSLVW